MGCTWRALALPIAVITALAWLPSAPGADPSPQTLPATQPAAIAVLPFPTDQPALTSAELTALYRRELGPLFNPQDVPTLLDASGLLEDYFDAGNSKERSALAEKIASLQLPPAIIGRLTRLRSRWPNLAGGRIYFIEQRRGPFAARYFLGVPRHYDRGKSWPLVITLPTTEAFPRSAPPAGDQAAAVYAGWINDELTRHEDAVIVVPLLDPRELFGPGSIGTSNALQPMFDVCDRVNVDPARVYLVGRSEGAFAAWNLALHFPTYFAAFDALAGAAGADWQRLRLINLRNLLPVVWHDAADRIVKPESSRSIVRALRAFKLDVEYIETRNAGHEPPAQVVEACYQLLRSRARNLYPRMIALQSNRPESVFNRNDWVQVWQPVEPGAARRIYFRHGAGFMTVDENTWRIDASIAGQRIDVRTDNVQSFRLYLNDQMVDLRQPVTVTVNQKPRFEASVRQDIKLMLKDQLILGRGWRYFSGFIDIDLLPPSTRPATQPG